MNIAQPLTVSHKVWIPLKRETIFFYYEYKQASYFTLHICQHTNNLQSSAYLSMPNIHHRKFNEMDYILFACCYVYVYKSKLTSFPHYNSELATFIRRTNVQKHSFHKTPLHAHKKTNPNWNTSNFAAASWTKML